MLFLGAVANGVRFILGGGGDPGETSGRRLLLTSVPLLASAGLFSGWLPGAYPIVGASSLYQSPAHSKAENALGVDGRIVRATVTHSNNPGSGAVVFSLVVDGVAVATATVPGLASDVRIDFDIPEDGVPVTASSKAFYRVEATTPAADSSQSMGHFEMEVEYGEIASWPLYWGTSTSVMNSTSRQYAPIIGGYYSASSNGFSTNVGPAGGMTRSAIAGTLRDIVFDIDANDANVSGLFEVFKNGSAVLSYSIPLGATGPVSIPGTVTTVDGDTLYYALSLPGRTSGGIRPNFIRAMFDSTDERWQLFGASGMSFRSDLVGFDFPLLNSGPSAYTDTLGNHAKVQLPAAVMRAMRGGAQGVSSPGSVCSVVRNGALTDMRVTAVGGNYTASQSNTSAEVVFEAGDLAWFHMEPRSGNIISSIGRHAFTYAMTPVVEDP